MEAAQLLYNVFFNIHIGHWIIFMFVHIAISTCKIIEVCTVTETTCAESSLQWISLSTETVLGHMSTVTG